MRQSKTVGQFQSVAAIKPFALAALMASQLITGCGPKFRVAPLKEAESPVRGAEAMVVAAHPLAVQAGLEVLGEGGNAVDGALAALFMLNVVEPHASGLGGGGFAVLRFADGSAKCISYRERTAAGIDTAFYYDRSDSLHTRMNWGGASICVPGAAAGWQMLYDAGASLPLERLARDAIAAAGEGFVVDQTLAGQIRGNFDMFSADTNMARTFLKEGLPYGAGDTLRQPELAATLQSLVREGLMSFYRGPIAEAVVAASQANGGFITLDDLFSYSATVSEPLKAVLGDRFAGCQVLTAPPPSSGGAAAIAMLNLIGLSGAMDYTPLSAEWTHLMAQCQQQAYVDAAAAIADVGQTAAGWESITSLDYAKRAVRGISLDAKPSEPKPLFTPDLTQAGNTTHLVVVDKMGNAVSLTQSINYFFGAKVMAPGSGLIMNNQMADFDLPPDTMNLIAGGVQPRSNMTPLIFVKNGRPLLVVGTPGGARIVSAVAQIATHALGHGRDISTAIDLPRFFAGGEAIVLENRFPPRTLKRLKKMGYIIHLAGPYHVYFGGAHGVWSDADGYLGAADKRRGGIARGL